MRNKQLVITKIEKLDNALTNLNSLVSSRPSVDAVREAILAMKESLQDIQTLLNTESDSWN